MNGHNLGTSGRASQVIPSSHSHTMLKELVAIPQPTISDTMMRRLAVINELVTLTLFSLQPLYDVLERLKF